MLEIDQSQGRARSGVLNCSPEVVLTGILSSLPIALRGILVPDCDVSCGSDLAVMLRDGG
jgi:hypothetical protein